MRRREHNLAARHWVRLAVLGSAPLAAVSRAEEAHESATELPVLRVAGSVLWAYRHGSSNSAFKLVLGVTLPGRGSSRFLLPRVYQSLGVRDNVEADNARLGCA